LAAVAGFVAVPGGPGAPNVLLAAAAATTAAVLAMHLGGTGPTLTALCCVTVLVAAAALAGVLTAISPHGIGALAAAASVALLHSAGRLSIALAGLTQPAGLAPAALDDRALRAHRLLTGLVAGLSTAATLGALGAATAAHAAGPARFGGVAVAGVAGAALLLRARCHTDRTQIAALLIGGSTAIGGSLAAAAASVPQHSLWPAAAAAAGAALYLAGNPVLPRASCRAIELLEYPVLTALAPLACWACGCYGAVRGLSLA
ncbi:MAG TPA: type VII secretion integral membrane protein EccD, partial [Mycobacterium sp.]|nr:type VII secretion integral membrane protein EccD [Mycobacterium sp.]